MTRKSVLLLLGLLALGLWGCAGGGKPTAQEGVTYIDVTLEPESPPEEVVDPKFRADQRLVREVLSRPEYQKNGNRPTVLVVNKTERRLTVFKGTKPLKSYPIVLGRNPRNDKVVQGDMATPEGIYRVVCKFPHTKWNKFILIDYPNTQNWLKYAKAKKEGKISPLADIGGQIGIHGTDDELKNLRGENWTMGCISLLNRHVDEIYPLIDGDTLVIIQRR